MKWSSLVHRTFLGETLDPQNTLMASYILFQISACHLSGKVVLRQWYERNKHIFPASRWEPYDPTKTYDKYTVADKK